VNSEPDARAISHPARPGYQWLLLPTALALGLAIAWIDSRPHWDDTGITVGLLFLSAAALTLLAPRRPWLVGLLVGFGVFAELARPALAAHPFSVSMATLGPLVVLVFPMAGAYGAFFLRRAFTGHSPA
jgi:hypothetical protein